LRAKNVICLLYPQNDFVSRHIKKGGRVIQCDVCPHRCVIAPESSGKCGTHFNKNDKLTLATYGRVVARAVEPIYKKPLRHFHPGSKVYSLALPGCTLSCRFCRNWEISKAAESIIQGEMISPQQIILEADSAGVEGVAFSHTEPVAGLEFALDVMALAKQAGLFTVWHTNAFMTAETIERVAPLLDAACVDVKFSSDAEYHHWTNGGDLQTILNAACHLKDKGVWIETATPVLMGINDHAKSLGGITNQIATRLGKETPWHVVRGVPGWKTPGLPITPGDTLKHAAGIGRENGLQHVYISG
jgi:pyruvate formate lyase activating enzyme